MKVVILSSIQRFPESHHFIQNTIAKLFSDGHFNKTLDEGDLTKFLENEDVIEIEEINHHGLMIAWGRKSKT